MDIWTGNMKIAASYIGFRRSFWSDCQTTLFDHVEVLVVSAITTMQLS